MTGNYKVKSGAFARINTTRAAGAARVFERPMHVVEVIDEVRQEERRNNKGLAIAILKSVLHIHSAPAEWHDGKIGKMVPMPQPRVGEQFTEYLPLSEDWAWPQLKSFLGTAFGVDPESVTDEHVEAAVGEGQPCRGIALESRKIERPNKSDTVMYVRTGYVRAVPATELADLLDEDGVKAYGGAERLTAAVQSEQSKG